MIMAISFFHSTATTYALPISNSHFAATYVCGSGSDTVKTSIDFGCVGKGNPILDLLFSIIRLLSDGVGLVIIASITVAGIQYIFSSGNPQAVAAASKRIQSSFTALILFLFIYAILNYIVPAGVFGL